MEDARYTNELINRFKAGVKVRVIMDLRANDTNQFNAQRLARVAGRRHPDAAAHGERHHALQADAVCRPGHRRVQRRELQRRRVGVHRRRTSNYVDESVYFTDKASFVHSFMTKFDDLWTNTSSYTNYANVPATAEPELPERLHQGSAAQFPAARAVREPGRRPVQQGDAEDRRDHVSHHGQAAHRRDDCRAQTAASRSA